MKKTTNNPLSLLIKGLLLENPVFVLVLGTCPTLAVTTGVKGAVGMGIAATLVLICSNIVISLLKKIIPDTVRIPSYIIVIAGFVTVVQMIMQALPALKSIYELLGVYLPLITVNCIILGRAEMFANKNTVKDSALDGVGMGLGFTAALISMALIREVLGKASFFDIPLTFLEPYKISFLAQPPGGFFVFGVLIAIVNVITKGKAPFKKDFSCEGCPSAALCHGKCGEGEEKEARE
ncbi:MAG: electron transport complex subunit RsxE [Clostridia bacterium]|nr:electron transport complex subunit RsxE [Clostridia bacterium]